MHLPQLHYIKSFSLNRVWIPMNHKTSQILQLASLKVQNQKLSETPKEFPGGFFFSSPLYYSTKSLYNPLFFFFFWVSGSNHRDISTCALLHSIGSDLTRMKVRSDTNHNGSIRSEQTISKGRDTPTSRAEASSVMNFL